MQDAKDKIEKIFDIVANCQADKVDGMLVDLYTASHIKGVYNALNDENRKKYKAMPVSLMASIAFKLLG